MSYSIPHFGSITAGNVSPITVFAVGKRTILDFDIPHSILPNGSGDEEFQARCNTIQAYYNRKNHAPQRYYPGGKQRYSRDCRHTLGVQSGRHKDKYLEKKNQRCAKARDNKKTQIWLSHFTGTVNHTMLRYYTGDPDVE